MKEKFNIDQQTSRQSAHQQSNEPGTASFNKSMKHAGHAANLTLITQGSDITDMNRNQSLNTLGNNLVKNMPPESETKESKRLEEFAK